MDELISTYISVAWRNANVRNLLRTVSFDVLAKGADFALLPLYLTLMTQRQFGIYTYLIYLLTTTAGVLRLGTDTAMSKLFYEFDEAKYRGEMLFSLNIFLIGFLLIVYVILRLSGADSWVLDKLLADKAFNSSEHNGKLLLYITLTIIQVTLNVYYAVANKIRVFQYYTLTRVLLVNAAVIIGLYLYGGDASTRISIETGVWLVVIIPLLYFYSKEVRFKLRMRLVSRALRIGLPMMGAVIVGIIYNVTDKYFLQRYTNMEHLAVYNLAIFLTTPVSLIFMSFHTLWIPHFFSEKKLTEGFSRTMKVCGLLAIGFALLCIMIWGCAILFLKLGKIDIGYHDIIWVYPFVAISKIIDNLAQLFNNYVVILEKTIFNLYSSIALGTIALIANLLFISKYGLWGAAIAAVVLAFLRITVLYTFTVRNLKPAL